LKEIAKLGKIFKKISTKIPNNIFLHKKRIAKANIKIMTPSKEAFQISFLSQKFTFFHS